MEPAASQRGDGSGGAVDGGSGDHLDTDSDLAFLRSRDDYRNFRGALPLPAAKAKGDEM